MRTLNVGCGDQTDFDVRLDFNRTKGAMALADAMNLPIKSGTMDYVYMKCLLEHLPNPGQALKEAFRVLKAGGKLHCITDNAACIFWHFNIRQFRFHDGHKYHGSPGDNHYMLYTKHHLRDLSEWAGFDNSAVWYEHAGTEGTLGRLATRLGFEPFVAERIILEAWK